MKLTLSLFCLGLGLATARPSLARAPQVAPLSRPFAVRVLMSLASAGIMPPGQAENTFGTMLLTFDNPAFHTGNEATAVARVWSFASGSAGPTNGTSYRAQPLNTGGAHALAGLVRNGEGLLTNIGIENVGIDDAGDPVEAPLTVRLTFIDPSTGAPVGTQPTFVLSPGQMTQISDIFDVDGTNSYQLPAGAPSLIVFAEARVENTAQKA